MWCACPHRDLAFEIGLSRAHCSLARVSYSGVKSQAGFATNEIWLEHAYLFLPLRASFTVTIGMVQHEHVLVTHHSGNHGWEPHLLRVAVHLYVVTLTREATLHALSNCW